MAKLNPKFTAKKSEPTSVVDNTEMERLYSDTEDENDFFIAVAQKFPTLSPEQSANLRALTNAFYRSGPGKALRSVTTGQPGDPATAQAKFDATMKRAAEKLRVSLEGLALVEKKVRFKIAAETTFHHIFLLGSKHGREGDHRRFSEYTTKAEQAEVEVEIG